MQIPLLHGKINNRLDKVLSVFDQSQRSKESQQVICLDEGKYGDDPEMMLILHRLSLASMSAEVRQEMNDEDEFFSAIEARDTQLMRMNKLVSEKNAQLLEQSAQLSEQSAQIKSMARAMLDNGMPIEVVAQTTNKSVDEVKALLDD